MSHVLTSNALLVSVILLPVVSWIRLTAESETVGTDVVIRSNAELDNALKTVKNRTTLKIGPGTYAGNRFVNTVSDLTVEALDPKDVPHFRNGDVAWQFSRCARLTIRNLKISGQRSNGINLDDGGDLETPVADITVEKVNIFDIGGKGNHDGIKGSGLTHLTIRDCTFEGWGGQAIDLVGCHDSLIYECRFTGKEGFSATAGIQMKGGSSKIIVEQCEFKDAGERPINVGGSTGLEFFRPKDAHAEAIDITVRGNKIHGSLCACAFVGVDGGEFLDNSIFFPRKWIFRILQESQGGRFTPCRQVSIRNNRIVFNRSDVQTEVNIGAGTAAETFAFESNQWFAADRPGTSRPSLPAAEKLGVYGTDPRKSSK